MNHQPAPINPPLDQKNEEPQKETEAKRSNISSQESSESSMDGNEEELNADGVKKLRKTKQKKHDKRQKKSSKITNVTDQEMVEAKLQRTVKMEKDGKQLEKQEA